MIHFLDRNVLKNCFFKSVNCLIYEEHAVNFGWNWIYRGKKAQVHEMILDFNHCLPTDVKGRNLDKSETYFLVHPFWGKNVHTLFNVYNAMRYICVYVIIVFVGTYRPKALAVCFIIYFVFFCLQLVRFSKKHEQYVMHMILW